MYKFVEIIAAEQSDHPRIVEVWESAVRATHHFLTEADIQRFKPLVRDQYLPMVELVVAKNEAGRIAGFAGVADGKLEMLFVDAPLHGRGIGRALLEHVIDVMGARSVDVNEQNPHAIAFYMRMGATIIGRSETDSLGLPFPLLHLLWSAIISASRS